MKKLLCLFGFHRIERRGRFIEICTRYQCNAQRIEVLGNPKLQRRNWRWDWSLFEAFR